LKALYVVHLTRSYRLIFDLANKIISPKFARKLNYCSTLAILKSSINLAPQFIPQRVIDHDKQLAELYPPPTLQQPAFLRPLPSLAFGRSLEDLAELEGIKTTDYIPKFVQQIISQLRERGTVTM
jgi:hypothetical protein